MDFETLAQQIEKQLDALNVQMRHEISNLGTAHSDTVRRITELSQQLGQVQQQIDAVDRRTQEQAAHQSRSGAIRLAGNESIERLVRDKRGTAVLHVPTQDLLEVRTTITSAGISVQPQRMSGIVDEARRELRIRDLLTSIPTTSNAVEYVQVSAHTKAAAPQAEGAVKAEDEITFSLQTVPVRTIATWIPATKQVLDDVAGLQAYVESALRYALDEEFEDQLLLGSGVGQNLNGLFTQAQSFDTNLLGTTWDYTDVLGRAIQQIASANEVQPSFVVVAPRDAWNLRLAKDANGQYIFGAPSVGGPDNIFGLSMVVSTAMTAGQFLIGSSAPNVAHIRMREEATVEISTGHSDYFTRNMVAIRAEMRAALVVTRPAAFVKGALTRSPA